MKNKQNGIAVKKQIIIMWAIIGVIFLSAISPALAQESGEITQLIYSPSEPVVFDDTTISIRVENSDKTKDYFMLLQIIKDGKMVNEQKFTFSLGSAKGITFTPQYTPQDIGVHEVVVKLFDKFQIDLLDTKVIDFNVVSHLGPFDIILDPLTTRIRPGFNLPVKLLLENMGTKGVDVEVRLSINCPDKVLTQTLTVFAPSDNDTERIVGMLVCDQEGLYEIIGSIILFNKTWVSSSSQFFVNSSYTSLRFDVPEKLIMRPGQNFTLPIEVTNLGSQKISNLEFVIQRIPLAWQKISPSSVTEVKLNETVIFIVEINIPQDAETRPYEARFTAVSPEVIERKIATLEVVALSTIPPIKSTGFSILTYVIISMSLLVSLIVSGIILQSYLRKRPYWPINKEKMNILKKIKEKIRAGA